MTGEDSGSTPFEELPLEIAVLLPSVSEEAASSVAELGNTWYLRPTPDLRDMGWERVALVAVLSLVADAEELSTRAQAWQEHEVLQALEPLEDIKANLPYTVDDLNRLNEVTASWNAKAKTWKPPLSERAQALVNDWHAWLRDPEPDPNTGELFISNGAGQLSMACSSLFERLTGRQSP